MKSAAAIAGLGAREHRLAIFRLLVEYGPDERAHATAQKTGCCA
jgi:hypothetical protein